MTATTQASSPGIVIRWPRAYDWLLRLMWGKREQFYRGRVLELAGVRQGDRILDVGCGTGTQAIAARRLVGPEGSVRGIDASAEMVRRARDKARANGVEIDFRQATAQALPFGDESFDLVVSTTVVHCLPEAFRQQSFAEMARVLVPGGRLLLVDFGGSSSSRHSLAGHVGVHGRFDLRGERERVVGAGFDKVETGAVGFSDLHYILAQRTTDAAALRATHQAGH